MSDKKPEKKEKRGYRVGGQPLAYDLRVRIDAETAEKLAEAAAKKGTTRAAYARSIIHDALSGGKG